MVPQSHLAGIGDFDLIAAHLPPVDFLAAHLHPGVAPGELKTQTQLKIVQFASAPDEPILVGVAAGRLNGPVDHGPRLVVTFPTAEILAVKNRREAGLVEVGFFFDSSATPEDSNGAKR